MCVKGAHTVSVIDNDAVAIGIVDARDNDRSGSRRVDVGTLGNREIDALMPILAEVAGLGAAVIRERPDHPFGQDARTGIAVVARAVACPGQERRSDLTGDRLDQNLFRKDFARSLFSVDGGDGRGHGLASVFALGNDLGLSGSGSVLNNLGFKRNRNGRGLGPGAGDLNQRFGNGDVHCLTGGQGGLVQFGVQALKIGKRHSVPVGNRLKGITRQDSIRFLRFHRRFQNGFDGGVGQKIARGVGPAHQLNIAGKGDGLPRFTGRVGRFEAVEDGAEGRSGRIGSVELSVDIKPASVEGRVFRALHRNGRDAGILGEVGVRKGHDRVFICGGRNDRIGSVRLSFKGGIKGECLLREAVQPASAKLLETAGQRHDADGGQNDSRGRSEFSAAKSFAAPLFFLVHGKMLLSSLDGCPADALLSRRARFPPASHAGRIPLISFRRSLSTRFFPEKRFQGGKITNR